MIAATGQMIAATSQHHAPRWRAVTSDGQDWSNLILDGGISKTSTSSPRTRAAFRMATSGAPKLLDQSLLPTGRDVQLRYRIHPYDGEIVVATGRLTIDALTRPESVWDAEVVDFSSVVDVDDVHPGEAGGIAAGSTVETLVRALVTRTLPAATFLISGPATTAPIPADTELDGSPWKIIEAACQSCGSEAFFDAAGRCVVRPEPGIGTPVDHLMVGEQGTITGYEISHEAGYSRVVLVYEDKSDPPVRIVGTWEDHRPDSPTAVERIGRVTLREDHGSLLGLPTQARADESAAALAQRAAGRARRATVRHIPRPWIEVGDTVSVTFSGGPTESHLVESIEIPIGPGVMVTALRNHSYRIEA